MARLKIEDIRKEVENEGWTLITESYSSLKTEMSFRCPEGHDVVYSLEKWRRSHKCPICTSNPLKNQHISSIKKTGYRVLAFDQASIKSGYSVFDNEKLMTYGTWTSNGNNNEERISQTKGWVAYMIEKWKPDLVVFEDIQLQKFGNGVGDENEGVLTFKKLAALQGVLKNYCLETGVVYQVVPPATWRHFSAIKGKTRTDRKRNAQLKVKKLYDISVDQDSADAILIGLWAANLHKKTEIIMFE